MDKHALNQALQAHFGYAAFKPSQMPLVEAIAQNKSVLGILPTGEGKSVCYQLPAIMLKGITIVISPLLALIHDQVNALHKKGISAHAITSATPIEERQRIFERLASGQTSLLYVAPELFARSDFAGRFGTNMPIRTVVFDEAHCLSQWGQDFRPSYVRATHVTSTLSKRYVDMGLNPIQRVAVTATATRKIQANICQLLAIPVENIIKGDLRRHNLRLNVQSVIGYEERTKALVNLVKLYTKERHPTIVYAHTRSNVESLVQTLRIVGVNAKPFHAGLSREEKDATQLAFENDDVNVVVATIAFGMGIDKSNVRAVIHFNAPQSIEDYYQQVGRAGRDGYPADCHLLFDHSSELAHVIEMLDLTQPSTVDLERAYQFMHGLYTAEGRAVRLYDETLAGAISVSKGKAKNIIEQLDRFNIIKAITQNDYAVRTLPSFQVFEAMDAVNQAKRHAIDVMLEFCRTPNCKMQFLMDYLGQPGTGNCGHCGTCQSQGTPERSVNENNLHGDPIYQDLVALRSRIGRSLNIPNFAIMSDAALKKITLGGLHEVDDLVSAGMSKLHATLHVSDIRAIVQRGDMALGSDILATPQSVEPSRDDLVDVPHENALNTLSR